MLIMVHKILYSKCQDNLQSKFTKKYQISSYSTRYSQNLHLPKTGTDPELKNGGASIFFNVKSSSILLFSIGNVAVWGGMPQTLTHALIRIYKNTVSNLQEP